MDDARNIARLALRLFRDGCPLVHNDGWGDKDRLTPKSRTTAEKRAAREKGRKEEGRAARLRRERRDRLHDVTW